MKRGLPPTYPTLGAFGAFGDFDVRFNVQDVAGGVAGDQTNGDGGRVEFGSDVHAKFLHEEERERT